MKKGDIHMNRTILVGRLTKDVDLRYTQNGKAVGNFTLAVNRPFKNAQGENEADFILCQVWGKQAENLANYMSKGSQIGVDGRIATRSYEAQDGKKVFVTEVEADNVQFLESKSNSSEKTNSPQQPVSNTYKSQNQAPTLQNQGQPMQDSDLPF